MNSFSGVYPGSRIPPVARAPSPYGPYPNDETSYFPRDNAGYNQTYGVIPTSDIRPYSNSAIGGHYSRPNIVGNNMAFPDPYRSCTNESFPISNAATMSFDYSRPYNDNRGFRPDLRTPSSATYGSCSLLLLFNFFSYFLICTFNSCCYYFSDSLSPYGTPSPRPPYGSLPDYKPYSGGYPSQRPRYS